MTTRPRCNSEYSVYIRTLPCEAITRENHAKWETPDYNCIVRISFGYIKKIIIYLDKDCSFKTPCELKVGESNPFHKHVSRKAGVV